MLYPICGFLTGIYLLIFKIKSDIRELISFSFELMGGVINDISKKGNKLSQSALNDIFKGIVLVIIIPSLLEAVSKQVPLIGNMISKLVQKALVKISNSITFSSDIDNSNDDNSNNAVSKYASSILKAKSKTDAIITRVFSSIQLPFKVLLIVGICILVVLILITT